MDGNESFTDRDGSLTCQRWGRPEIFQRLVGDSSVWPGIS
jgi:hypothetical protein